MTWRAIHRYGEGQFSLAMNSGERRAPTSAEARQIALELERFAINADAAAEERIAVTSDYGRPRPPEPVYDPSVGFVDDVTPPSGYLADPDVDFALFRDKNHPVVAVVQVRGGCRLRCLACHVEGTRVYQDEDGAQAYARMLSGVRIPAWPKCTTPSENVP